MIYWYLSCFWSLCCLDFIPLRKKKKTSVAREIANLKICIIDSNNNFFWDYYLTSSNFQSQHQQALEEPSAGNPQATCRYTLEATRQLWRRRSRKTWRLWAQIPPPPHRPILSDNTSLDARLPDILIQDHSKDIKSVSYHHARVWREVPLSLRKVIQALANFALY